MVTKIQARERRAKVAQMLAKSVTSIKEISKALEIPYDTVQNDIKWLKEQTKPWLIGLAEEGFAFDCKVVIDKLLSIEREIEEMSEKAKSKPDSELLRLQILEKLIDIAITRLNVEAEGPTLMALRRITRGDFTYNGEKVGPFSS